MKNRLILVVLFLFIIGISFFAAFKSGDFRGFEQENTIVLKASNFAPDFSARNFSESGLQSNSYTIKIPINSFETLDGNSYKVIINRLSDNAHAIYFNDVLIGSNGDFEKANSNLWNGIFAYDLSSKMLEDTNTLRIDTYASYRSGLSTKSVYITASNQTNSILGTIRFYGEQINTFMLGFIFLSSFITFFFYYLNGKSDPKYLYITIATILTAVYYCDYLTFNHVIIPYIIYKKITIGSLFIGASFYSYVISRYFDNKGIKLLGHFMLIGTLCILIISTDLVFFKQLYTYWYFVLLANVFSWIFVSIKYIRKRFVAFIFLISFTAVGIYGGTVVLMDVFGSYFEFNSPVFYIVVFSVIPLLLVYEAIHEKEMLLLREKNLREKEFVNSITDSLTNTWNQRYMSMIFNDRLGSYSMALVDIDNFKGINDTFGHLAGDYILVNVAKLLKAAIREKDIVVRYGGDEFVVILKDCNLKESHRIMEKVRHGIEDYPFTYDGTNIKVSISIGLTAESETHNVEHVFNICDKLLYEAKANGKNSIVSI